MRPLALTLLTACAAADSGMEPLAPDATPPACDGADTYPTGAVEPMALGEVLSPYRWPEATHLGRGDAGPLDLAAVPCAADPDIDWSPFDVLLFVSIPAW